MTKQLLLRLGCLCCGVVAVFLLFSLFAPPAFAAKKKSRRSQPKQKDEHVYLVHADVLRYDQFQNPDAQILTGKVQFRHKGATLHCDSAYFYEASNSSVTMPTTTAMTKWPWHATTSNFAIVKPPSILTA